MEKSNRIKKELEHSIRIKGVENMQILIMASEGYVLTDGKDVYAPTIRIAEGAKVDDYHEITQAEYEEIEKAIMSETMPRENEME